MPAPELNSAIDRLVVGRLQAVLKKVCDESAEARAIVEEELLAAPSPSGHGIGLKRPRFLVCINCKEEYDVTENDEDSCQWHDGNLEVDWDGGFWADHDERCHGTIDDDGMRKEYPEGFMWDCCDENGEAEGCETGPHQAESPMPATKRLKIGDKVIVLD